MSVFEQEKLRIINGPAMVAELQAYELERLPSGLIRYSAPHGLHNDAVIAAGFAWYGARKSGPVVLW
ncbi:MAG TPA: hypothetical protein VFI27_08155 [candidate division Zixibacteria bacterium]|nr:hypothetical protein [candidate division Zixibacteria bacterium]